MSCESRARDAELVRLSSAGDTEAFRQLYEDKHRRVYLIAYQIVGDSGLAEDVVQETFVALWKHCGGYRSRFAVDTWLNRIATNRAIDRWRSERKHRQAAASAERASSTGDWRQTLSPPFPATEAAGSDPSLRARWHEIQAIWDELAAELSPQQRAAFVLREIEDLPVRDVAEALGCGTSTVRSHISQARKALRTGIRERFPDYWPSRKADLRATTNNEDL